MHAMRLLFRFLLIGLIAQAPAWALGSQPFLKDSFLNLQEDLADAGKAGRLLMVVYEQEGCPYCAQLHQVHFKDAAIVAALKKHFDVIQLDIWGGREVTDFTGATMTEKQLARKLKVQFSPTIAFYDAQGREIYRMAGLHKPAVFKSELDYLASRSFETMRFKDYAAKPSGKATPKGLIDEPFFARTDNLQTLAEQARAEDKVLALLFEQAACETCQRMHDRNFMDGDTVKLLTEQFRVARIDMAGSKPIKDLSGKTSGEGELAKSLGIRQTPTLVFFDRNGQEILRYEDHLIPEHFTNLLVFLGSHAYRRHASFQDWLRARAAEGATAQ
ncbi:MAG: thioredoxin fold domain-containing protein [Hydrogenophilaceae bacterium]|nr:thioredoxin fold domain-containing protein [Hydrogenophilaceae bacterium]